MREKVETAMLAIRPFLQEDGGDAEVVDVTEDGVVKVRLTGACGGCPMSKITLSLGIEKKLNAAVPEVTRVESVSGIE